MSYLLLGLTLKKSLQRGFYNSLCLFIFNLFYMNKQKLSSEKCWPQKNFGGDQIEYFNQFQGEFIFYGSKYRKSFRFLFF